MANDISSVGSSAARTPNDIINDIDSKVQKLSGGDAEKVKEIYKQVVEILSGENVRVARGGTAGVDGNTETKTGGTTGVPVLDNPDDAKAKEADLAKLIAFLQLDNEERQTEMARSRIETQKATLDVEHKGRMKEINDSIKKMKDAEKAALASRIFGWIGAVLAVAAAVVLTVVTGGAAAGFAIAGAVIAVSSLVLNETGAMDKITEKLAEHLQEKYGMSKSDAQLAASLIINLSIMAVSLGCSVGGMVSGFTGAVNGVMKLSESALSTAKTVQTAITIANTAVSAGALAAGGVSTAFTKRAEDAKADLMELEKFITMLQQQLDESEEELQQLLQMIESALGRVAELIGSATDTSNEIAEKIGDMA